MYNSPCATLEGRLLCASVLAYSVPDKGIINPPNNNIQQTIPYNNGAGYKAIPTMIASDKDFSNAACTVGITQDGIVLAFRGTVPTAVTDWLNDFLLDPIALNGIPGKVHKGFNKAVNAIFSPVLQTIQQLKKTYPNAKLFITGHSKGAGMSPIAAYYLYQKGIKADALYLYAPPAPGTADFATAFNKLFPLTFLFENYLDIVPLMPPSASTAVGLDYYLINSKSTEIRALAVIFAYIGTLGYTSVGISGTTFYIPKPVNNKYTVITLTNTIYQQQMQAIADALLAGDFKSIASAHSSHCFGGYMNALSGNVCFPIVEEGTAK